MDGATTAASVAMIAMTTSNSMSVKPRRSGRAARWDSFLDDTKQLLHSGLSLLDLEPAIRAERNQAALERECDQCRSRTLVTDRVLQVIGHRQELEHPHA